jgi:hypothetical protein
MNLPVLSSSIVKVGIVIVIAAPAKNGIHSESDHTSATEDIVEHINDSVICVRPGQALSEAGANFDDCFTDLRLQIFEARPGFGAPREIVGIDDAAEEFLTTEIPPIKKGGHDRFDPANENHARCR